MERFAPALRRVAKELDLPRHARIALLLEMAADLESAYEHHRGQGLAEEQAVQRAEAAVLGSSEVIARLARLHGSPWRGWAEEMGARLMCGVDAVLLCLGVLPVVAAAGGAAVPVLAEDASPAAWILLLLGVLMTAMVAVEAGKRLRGRPSRHRQLPALLVLSAMAPCLGLLALVLGLSRAGAAFTADAVGQAVLLSTVARDGATLLAGLLLGLAGLLAWLVLVGWQGRRAAREVDALLSGDGAASPSSAVPPHTGSILPLVRRRHG